MSVRSIYIYIWKVQNKHVPSPKLIQCVPKRLRRFCKPTIDLIFKIETSNFAGNRPDMMRFHVLHNRYVLTSHIVHNNTLDENGKKSCCWMLWRFSRSSWILGIFEVSYNVWALPNFLVNTDIIPNTFLQTNPGY